MVRRLALACLWVGGPLLHAEEPTPPPFVREKPGAVLESPALGEASGLAASQTNPDLLWLVNDSGSPPELHLAGTDGTDRGKVTVRDAKNLDWEDLSSFVLEGKPYLLIADSGDNNGKRNECTLYVVAEPKLPAKGEVPPAWTIRFRYEDGPRDCEAVAVDALAGKILLISKRTTPPLVYELPLKPAGKEIVVAKKIGEISHPFPRGLPLNPYSAQPTGFDISADGSIAVVVTYFSTFVFAKTSGETWKEAFAKPPAALEPHRLRQAESVAFSRDGSMIYAVSEGGKSPVARFRKP